MRVVLFTQGDLGVPVAEQLAGLAEVRLAGIFLERPPIRRRTWRERLTRNLKYRGAVGTVRHFLSSLLPQPAEECGSEHEAQLRRTAERERARFLIAQDLHAPEVLEAVRDAEPDLGVVLGTTILRPALYEIPRLGSINLHQARVPEYRGSSPLFWALMENERDTAVTVHQVAESVDAGDVLLERVIPLSYDFSRYGTRFEAFVADHERRIREPSVDVVVEAVRQLALGTARRRPQDPSRSVRRKIPTFREQQALRQELRRRYLQLGPATGTGIQRDARTS